MTRAGRLLRVLVCIVAAGCGSSTSPGSAAPAVPSEAASAQQSATPTATPSPSLTASPSPTPSPTPSPSPTPAPWQTYASRLNHYTISYPPQWLSRPGAKDRLDEFDSLAYARVYVGRQTYSFTVDAADFARQEIDHLRKTVAAKLVSNKPITLAGGYTGRIIEMTYTDVGIPVGATLIIVGKGRIEYDVNMYVDYPKTSPGRELFPQIYKSWRPTK